MVIRRTISTICPILFHAKYIEAIRYLRSNITEYIYQGFFRQYENSISLHKLDWETQQSIDAEIITLERN